MLVQNEAFELVATLRNPFVFDLELSSLALRLVSFHNNKTRPAKIISLFTARKVYQ